MSQMLRHNGPRKSLIVPLEFQPMSKRENFLMIMLIRLRADPRCSGMQNQIKKKTVAFCFRELKCDLTMCVGLAEQSHRSFQSTAAVKDTLDINPQILRDLCCLVVDQAHRHNVCSQGDRPIGSRLKAVHWVLQKGCIAFVVCRPVLAHSSFLAMLMAHICRSPTRSRKPFA